MPILFVASALWPCSVAARTRLPWKRFVAGLRPRNFLEWERSWEPALTYRVTYFWAIPSICPSSVS